MDAIFNMYKVRFDKLDALFDAMPHGLKPGDTVNVYLNLEMVLKTLLNRDVEQYVQVRPDEKHQEFIANVLNFIAHYRLFFTKNKLKSRVFLYANDVESTYFRNQVSIPTYREFFKDKLTIRNHRSHFVRLLTHTFKQIETIAEYIEDVHFIRTREIEPSLVPLFVMRELDKPAEMQFIVSNDRYDYQYALHGAYILRPKKEHSYIVHEQNLWRLVKLEEKLVNEVELPPAFYPVVLAMLGDKYRNIPKIKGVGLFALMKVLRKALDDRQITESMNSVHAIANAMTEKLRPMLIENSYATDLHIQYLVLTTVDRMNLEKKFVNRFDNVGLKQINETYFVDSPIMLIELTSTPTTQRKPNKNIFY